MLVCLAAAVERLDRFPALRRALQRSPATAPGAPHIAEQELRSGLAILSLSIDEKHLHDPATGIVANATARGPEWERTASVSYADRGRVVFSALAGLRIHGEGSRSAPAPHSYRLYFRRRFGVRQFAPGALFDGRADPVRRLVVHNDRRASRGEYWHLTNPLAYDIARQVGIPAPETQPVRLFLNGRFEGVYVLTERLDADFFARRFGHGSFEADERSRDELYRWASAAPRLTMEEVAARVDLDNLTRWFIAYTFCDTLDAYQTPGQFRDQTASGARWFWVAWDMDYTFRRFHRDTGSVILGGDHRPERFRRVASEPRALLLLKLLEDPDYRQYYLQAWQQTLNHRLTPAFLNDRFAHYQAIARDYGIRSSRHQQVVKQFLDRRPASIRGVLERRARSGTSPRLHLSAPPDLDVLIDGFPVADGYVGHYFRRTRVTLSVVERPGRRRFSHWRVGGSVHATRSLTLVMNDDTVVHPVLH
jgi:hypothetical protein